MDVLSRRFPNLRSFPWRDLGVRPTPVEERTIGGVRLLVKRDDLSSPLYGGNKPRSLEFLLALPARRILTISSLSAHHAWATAVHAATLGLPTDVILVRRGTRGALADRLRTVAARVTEVGGAASATLHALALWRPGTRILLPGGMSPRGALGYVAAALELEAVPRRIYVPLGTGTTVSGLLAGLMLRSAECEVVAVRVADRIAGLRRLLWSRAFRAIRLLRAQDPSVPRPRAGGVRLRVVAAEGRYGERTPAAAAAVEAARLAGLALEETYTGKTLALLLAEAPREALLWNTYCPGSSVPDVPNL